MSVIAAIAAQRQKLLDGLDANEGDINLRIFEDFYPDEAHFIYELLQNAEDAEATEVSFELYPDHCAFEHNGARHFDERDIRAITGIFNSSKKENANKIGKFGVGFKSVFVYTETPIVFSKNFSFKILNLVLPQEVAAREGLGDRTRFEFPFNNTKKDSKAAFAEVKQGLEQLSETTLLHLNNLGFIHWTIGAREGEIRRKEHSGSHVEILKQISGEEVSNSHWLRFSDPVQDMGQSKTPGGESRQKVAIAFELTLLSSAKSFDKSKPLFRQMKIVPALKGSVSVFFPAEKESSGLRFHLHGPFVPELSRASIKNTPENLPLFSQLAILAAKSLYLVRDAGLLSGEFLAVLPNGDDALPERYTVIRKAILEEMRSGALVPTYRGGFAPATRLVQARAAMKTLLGAEDLALVLERVDDPEWAIGATQRNSNQDRFLASLGIPNWDSDKLKEFLERNSRDGENEWYDPCEMKQEVLGWVTSKSFEWLQTLYSVLEKQCAESEDYGKLSDVYVLKLTSGEIGTGAAAYFQTGSTDPTDPLPRVDQQVLTAGTKKVQQEEARRFLEKIGVREPNEEDELHQLLRRRYGSEGDAPSDKVYLADLKRMMAFSEKHQGSASAFHDAYVFRVASPQYEWTTSESVFIDDPFATTGLARVFDLANDEDSKKWPLSDWYLQCGIPLERLVRFARYAGCKAEFDDLYVKTDCWKNPSWNYLREAPGQRAGNMLNRDFTLSSMAMLLVRANRVDASLLIWQALCKAESTSPSPLKARFQWTDKGGPRECASQMVSSLKDIAWIPLADGTFVRPSSARRELLPKGFAVDSGYKWLAAVGFGMDEIKRANETAARASGRAELGFKSEDQLQRALSFVQLLSEDEQNRVLAHAEQAGEPVELPERPVNNPELRQRRVSEEAQRAPNKEAVVRERSVQLGVAEAKSQAKLYLADQYTNSRGQMICQVCRGELPFKLPNGAYYFEVVEVLADSPKRFREAYLALCPNHAAAYQYSNGQRNQMQELVATASGNEIEVALGGTATSIYFTQMHLADVQACLSSEELEE
jgi:hypothetical protein